MTPRCGSSDVERPAPVEELLTQVLGAWAAASVLTGAATYLAAGAWLVRDGRWRADGAAVLVQGGFLLALDSLAALALGRGEC